MSRKTNTVKALVVAGAVAGAAFGLTPAQAAGETITSVGPTAAATTTESVITIKGTNFSSSVDGVKFTADGTTTTCAASSVVVVSSTQLYAKKPATGCAAGKQKVELFSGTTSLHVFNPTDVKKTVTFAAPQVVTAIAPAATGASAGGAHVGGTEIKITVSTTLPETGISATIGGKPVANLKRVDGTTLTGKAPAGVPGDAQVVVTANSVASAPFPATAGGTGTWTYKRAIKVSPNIMVKGSTAPIVKIDTVGLPLAGSAGTVVVKFGTVTATEATTGTGVKPRSATTMYVTAPAFPSTSGPVNVTVTVDPDGSGSLPSTDSVVTGTSGFVYADY